MDIRQSTDRDYDPDDDEQCALYQAIYEVMIPAIKECIAVDRYARKAGVR